MSKKKTSLVRSYEERKLEVRKILDKLTELNITIHFEAVRELFTLMSKYLKEGIRQEVNIDFPEFGRKIKGVLAENLCEQVWVKLEKS
jgi:hypothetical protein